MEKYDSVTVNTQLGGSSVGVTDAQSGKSQIGNVSRKLKDTETGLVANTIAIDGIAVSVNSANKVSNLTKDQLAKIFTGEIKNWKDVGGDDAAIVVIGREASSGTREAFEDIVGVKEKCKYAQEKTETGAVKTAVQSTPNAIGYISLEAVDDTIKTLTLDGVQATEENIRAETYFLSRPFIMATKEGSTDKLAKAFIDYVLSSDGQSVVKSNKLITVK
jgi:phosphate transport system substrate-binding protein